MATATATPQRRTAPRAEIQLPLTFTRRKGHGNPVLGQTLDLSVGGARVSAARPLKVDELLEFDLSFDGQIHICGECRVLREHVGQTYAVRFERLDGEQAARRELERLTVKP